jgi:hypothetical protein
MRPIVSAVLLALLLYGCAQAPAPPAPETDTAQVQAAANKPAADGAMCGGYPGVQCMEGSYCAIDKGECKVIADVTGKCARKPEVCTQQYQPVCGCNGKTYSNACMAAAAGTSVASDGECK